jgi:hypothetical protein
VTYIGTHSPDHLLLLFPAIDTDESEAHGLGVLASQGAETSTCTNNGDSLSWSCS